MSNVNYFLHKFFKREESRKGFTLIEVMVAVSIFTIVVTIGMGALLVVNDAYKRSRSSRQAAASVSSAVEYMLRQMRTGYSFVCDDYFVQLPLAAGAATQDCFLQPSDGITFLDQDDQQQTITFNNSAAGYPGVGQILKNGTQRITDPSIVDINSLKFYVRGVEDIAPTNIQPFVIVQVEGSVVGQPNSSFIFQSAISQRLLDVK